MNFYHGLIDWVGGLIRKDAGGKAGNDLDRANFMCCLQHVVIDVDIVSLEGNRHVSSNRNKSEAVCWKTTQR